MRRFIEKRASSWIKTAGPNPLYCTQSSQATAQARPSSKASAKLFTFYKTSTVRSRGEMMLANLAVEQTAGSHSLAAVVHRKR